MDDEEERDCPKEKIVPFRRGGWVEFSAVL